MIPFPGIINGLLVPVLLVLPYLLAMSVQETRVTSLCFMFDPAVVEAFFHAESYKGAE